MYLPASSLFLFSLLPLSLASAAPDPQSSPHLLAQLDYGSFQGAYSEAYNVSYWQKIPYAAPPTGPNRFRAPQPPLPVGGDGVYDSSQAFDMCPQRTVNGSEDCLYLSLYSRPWTPSSPLRPVVVTYHGGAFIQGGGGALSIPPPTYPILNVSDTTDIVFLFPNYRLNAFGFLPGREVAADPGSDTNVGLRDQRAVLEWVQKNAAQFGGDPDNVAVWGQSAGAGSVVAQVIAQQQQQQQGDGSSSSSLFNKAWASSPFWPRAYRNDDDEAQAVYDRLVDLTGCSAAQDSLACLKSLDVQTIRDANLVILDSHHWNTSAYTWAPVTGDDFLPYSLTEATDITNAVDHPPHVNGASSFGMYNTHEGEPFVPPGLQYPTDSSSAPQFEPYNSSLASFNVWLSGYLPRFNKCDLSRVKRLYPAAGGTTETESYNSTYERAGLIYRDTVLACPAYWQAAATSAKDGGKGWLGEYTISPAKHGSDTYWWNKVNKAQKEQPLIYKGYSGAFASFFTTSDPNALKLTDDDVQGVPEIQSGLEWVIGEDGFETAKLVELKERCDFWRAMGPKVPI